MGKLKLLIEDEFGEIEAEIGYVEKDSIKHLAEIADKNKMKCLSFVATEGNTIFGEEQVWEIKKEIEILEKLPDVDKNFLAIIKKGCDEAIKEVHLYLKFEDTDN